MVTVTEVQVSENLLCQTNKSDQFCKFVVSKYFAYKSNCYLCSFSLQVSSRLNFGTDQLGNLPFILDRVIVNGVK